MVRRRLAWVAMTLGALALSACRPAGLCEAPRQTDGAHSCPQSCATIDLMREDGDCFREDAYFCLEERPLSAGGSCVVDADGVRHTARWTGFLDVLEPLGWRSCTADEAVGFPADVCE